MIVFYKAHVRIFVNQMTSLWITIELWGTFTVDVSDKLIKASLKRQKFSCAMDVHLIFPGVLPSACGCSGRLRSHFFLFWGCSCDWLYQHMKLHSWGADANHRVQIPTSCLTRKQRALILQNKKNTDCNPAVAITATVPDIWHVLWLPCFAGQCALWLFPP